MALNIRFCVTPDGASIAYTTLGGGPALVIPSWSVNHLEALWESAPARTFFETLARHHTLVLHDRWGPVSPTATGRTSHLRPTFAR